MKNDAFNSFCFTALLIFPLTLNTSVFADEDHGGRPISKKWEESIPALKRQIEKDPTSIDGLNELVRALVYVGRRDEGLDYLNQAVAKTKGAKKIGLIQKVNVVSRLFLTNKTFETYQNGLNFLFGKKYHGAAERFEKALSDEPYNSEILLRLGQSLLLDENPKQAIEYLNKAQKLNPYESENKLWLGRALFQSGNVAGAVLQLKAANTELKTSELAPIWLAEALVSQGWVGNSIRVLENDVRTSPLHVLSLLASARLRLSGHPDSQTLWQARKEVQLAMSRLDPYYDEALTEKNREEVDLSLDLRRPQAELKIEIQRLQQQIDQSLRS